MLQKTLFPVIALLALTPVAYAVRMLPPANTPLRLRRGAACRPDDGAKELQGRLRRVADWRRNSRAPASG